MTAPRPEKVAVPVSFVARAGVTAEWVDACESWRRLFWDAEPPTLENVCKSLSREPRYFGQGRFAWSVVAHSLLVADLAPPECRLPALTHDLGEAVSKDQPTPLKQMFPDLGAWCERVQGEMLDALGIRRPTEEERRIVKEADRTAFAAEVMTLFPPDRAEAFLANEEKAGGPLDMDRATRAVVVSLWPGEMSRRLCTEISRAVVKESLGLERRVEAAAG